MVTNGTNNYKTDLQNPVNHSSFIQKALQPHPNDLKYSQTALKTLATQEEFSGKKFDNNTENMTEVLKGMDNEPITEDSQLDSSMVIDSDAEASLSLDDLSFEIQEEIMSPPMNSDQTQQSQIIPDRDSYEKLQNPQENPLSLSSISDTCIDEVILSKALFAGAEILNIFREDAIDNPNLEIGLGFICSPSDNEVKVLLDPGANGLEICKNLRAQYPGRPIQIYMMASSEEFKAFAQELRILIEAAKNEKEAKKDQVVPGEVLEIKREQKTTVGRGLNQITKKDIDPGANSTGKKEREERAEKAKELLRDEVNSFEKKKDALKQEMKKGKESDAINAFEEKKEVNKQEIRKTNARTGMILKELLTEPNKVDLFEKIRSRR